MELNIFIFVSIIYLSSFIGFFSYILYERSNIYYDKNPYELKQIKADPFIEDLLKEIQDSLFGLDKINIIIILFSISIVLFIIDTIIACRMAYKKGMSDEKLLW